MDDRNVQVPGSRNVATVLSGDIVYRSVRSAILSPGLLGVVLALIVAIMIVFSPSTDSRFIYTDF